MLQVYFFVKIKRATQNIINKYTVRDIFIP
jgi:hypothetical protein